MGTLSLSEAKMKLSALAESVNATDEEIIITKNGKPVAVLVSPDEFESWRETMHVRADTDLMKESLRTIHPSQVKWDAPNAIDELFK